MKMFRLPKVLWRRRTLPGVLMWCAWAAGLFGAQAEDAANRLERNYQQAHAQFMAHTNDAQAAWQFARACFDEADGAPNNGQRARFANEGITAAQQALADDNNSAAAHYYLGMNIGQLADTKRNLSGLHLVKDMEREFTAARLLDEHFDHAGPDRNLGLLYEDAPVLISIGSRSKAREHLEKSVELSPDFPENRLNLVEAYLKWDYHEEAVQALKDLEKVWPAAKKKYSGDGWPSSWVDWDKRLDAAKRKLEKPKAHESPHSTQ